MSRVGPATRSVGHGQAGVVGGLEVLAFGVLIFVAGGLLVANAWAVVDAKMATTAAAREAGRVYVEAPTDGEGMATARTAATDAVASYGRDPARLDLTRDATTFARCQRITFRASYQVPAIRLPFGIGFGHGVRVTARHSEIVDPLRTGLPAGGGCG